MVYPVKLPVLIIKSMQNTYTDEDLKITAKAYLLPLQEQFRGISDYLLDRSSVDSAQKNIEANRLVKMASGIQLVNSANTVSKNLKSIFSRLSINSIVKEINSFSFGSISCSKVGLYNTFNYRPDIKRIIWVGFTGYNA